MSIAKRLLLAGTCLSLLAGAARAAEHAPAAVLQALPPQELSTALNALARMSGRNVLYAPELVAGKRSGAVGPAAPFARAMKDVLAGTGLTYVLEPDGSVTIVPAQGAAARPAIRRPIATPAPAADAGDEVDEVVVQGVRRSLAEAIRLKREAGGVIDAVAAEDIAKFPEENLAEAIQRIPGVAITRDQGEGVAATIRGLPPSLTQVRVNGAAGATGEVGREFSFDIFSADLFSSVEVIKTYSADQDEGGVAGTISLRSPTPFELPARAARASAQLSYVDISGKTDARGSALASGRFADDRLGLLLGVAYSDRSLRQDNSSGNGWTKLNIDLDKNGTPEHSGVYAARLLRSQLFLEDRRRLGGVAAVQFRPSDRAEIGLDLAYTNFQVQRLRTNRAYSFADGGTLTAATVADGTVVAGTFDRTRIRTTVRTETEENDLLVGNLRGEWRLNDWTIKGRLAYSGAESTIPDGAIVRYEARGLVSYDIRDNPKFPQITGGQNPLSGEGIPFSQIQFDGFSNTDRETAAQADAERRLGGWVEGLDFGVKATRREKERQAFQDVSTLGRGAALSVVAAPFPVDDYFDGEGGPNFVRSYLVPDMAQVRKLYYPAAIPHTPDPLDTFKVVEETLAGYAKADLDFTLFDRPVRGNVGVRAVRTDQTSSGFVDDAGAVSPVRASRDYTDVLPSANLRIELRHDLLLRLGAAKVMTRPQLADISPRREIFAGQLRLEEGNVNLDPFRAAQGDVSLEWYYGREALLSVAAFYKDIKSFTATRETYEPFRGETYLFSRIINGDGGHVAGVEVALQQPFTWAPAPFDGFGVALNYNYTQSSTSFPQAVTNERFPLEGLSKNTYNAVVYYEKGRVSLRGAYTYRDRYLETALGAGGVPLYVAAYGQLDLSAVFRLNDRYTVQVEALNVTDERQYRYSGKPNQIADYDRTGPKYFIGVSARF